MFTRRCLPLLSSDDLNSHGIDTQRGAAVAFSGIEEGRLVAALPLHDPDRFLLFARQLIAKRTTMTLSGTGEGRVLEAIRIDRNESSGVRFCLGGEPRPLDLAAGTVLEVPDAGSDDKEVRVTVMSDLGDGATVRLSCTAIYADGETGACTCRLEEKDCGDAVEVGLPKLEAMEIQAESGRLDAWKLEDEWLLSILDAKTALLSNDEQLLSKAALNQSANLDFFRNDDSFLHSYRLLPTTPGVRDALLFGMLRPAAVPVMGNVPFVLRFDEQRVAFDALLSLETWQTTFFERLIEPSTGASSGSDGAARLRGADLTVTDPHIGYYARFVYDYIEGAKDAYHEALGNFFVIFQELMGMEETGDLTLSFLGIRDGVPDLALTLNFDSSEQANDLLFKLQRDMRLARDRIVLERAIDAYAEENGGERPAALSELAGFLEPEQPSFFDRYDIADTGLSQREGMAFTAEDFVGPSYGEASDQGRIAYIPPPVMENDLRYRFSEEERSELDIEALRRNRFRLAAAIDAAEPSLIFGSDATAIELKRQSTVPDDQEDGGDAAPKLELRANPAWLIDQAKLYPDEELQKLVDDYLINFDQYRRLTFMVDANEAYRGLVLSLVLHHD